MAKKKPIAGQIKNRIDLTIRPERSGRRYHIWGKDNAYPFYLRIAVRDSAAASVAMFERQRYTIGEDWAENSQKWKDYPVATADGLVTLHDFYVQLCKESAFYEGSFAIRVKRNIYGVPKEFIPTPLACYRKSNEAGYYVFSPYFSEPYQYTIDQDLLQIPEYQPDLDPFEAVKLYKLDEPDTKYWGELLVVHSYKPVHEVYHYPSYGGGIEILQGAALTQKAIKKRATTSFLPAVIFTSVGKLDDENQGQILKGGDASRDAGASQTSKLQAQLANMTTPDNPTTSIVMLANNKDSIPDIKLLDTDKLIENMDSVQKGMDESVYRALGVPPVLCGVSTPGQLGSNQELANNERLFNQRVKLYRKPVLDTIETLFDITIDVVDVQGFNYLEPEAMKYMSRDEVRKYYGLPPEEKVESVADKLAALPDGLQSAIMAAMTQDEIRSLIDLTPVGNATAQ